MTMAYCADLADRSRHIRRTSLTGGEGEPMYRKSSIVVSAVFAFAVIGSSATTAFAGEVTGAPGTPGVAFSGSGVRTGAPAHSNSLCSYNGLNDMNPRQGPIDNIVQTPHTQGSPGQAGHGTCAGGTNFENPPTP
jgi:hypothetical protein